MLLPFTSLMGASTSALATAAAPPPLNPTVSPLNPEPQTQMLLLSFPIRSSRFRVEGKRVHGEGFRVCFAMLDFSSPTTKTTCSFVDHVQRPAGSTTSTMPLGSKHASKSEHKHRHPQQQQRVATIVKTHK